MDHAVTVGEFLVVALSAGIVVAVLAIVIWVLSKIGEGFSR